MLASQTDSPAEAELESGRRARLGERLDGGEIELRVRIGIELEPRVQTPGSGRAAHKRRRDERIATDRPFAPQRNLKRRLRAQLPLVRAVGALDRPREVGIERK